MTKHTCKNCNRVFEYCRGCLLSPIPYKDAGFCSKECYEASKHPVVTPVEAEPIKAEVLIEDVTPIIEVISEEVETEAIASVDTSIVEATKVVEPTIKKETNTYKKKKNKYK